MLRISLAAIVILSVTVLAQASTISNTHTITTGHSNQSVNGGSNSVSSITGTRLSFNQATTEV